MVRLGQYHPLRTDRDGDGTYESAEHRDSFTLDSNDYAVDAPAYDAAGNTTYDGQLCFTYDPWNRLTQIAHGYRDDSGVLHSGSAYEVLSYDGNNQRISKQIIGTGATAGTEHYYYDDQWRLIETRNASDQTIKQNVWGQRYIDELVQVAVNTNPESDNTAETAYYAAQDANWNVLGIVDEDGTLVER